MINPALQRGTSLAGEYDDERRRNGDERPFVSGRIAYFDGARLAMSTANRD